MAQGLKSDPIVSKVFKQAKQAVSLRFQRIIVLFMNQYGVASIRERDVFMRVAAMR